MSQKIWISSVFSLACLLVACGDLRPYHDDLQACHDHPRLQRFTCYRDLAFSEGNIGFCDYIIDSAYRVNCKTDFAKRECDVRYCDDISEEWKQTPCREKVLEWKRRSQCDTES